MLGVPDDLRVRLRGQNWGIGAIEAPAPPGEQKITITSSETSTRADDPPDPYAR